MTVSVRERGADASISPITGEHVSADRNQAEFPLKTDIFKRRFKVLTRFITYTNHMSIQAG